MRTDELPRPCVLQGCISPEKVCPEVLQRNGTWHLTDSDEQCELVASLVPEVLACCSNVNSCGCVASPNCLCPNDPPGATLADAN